MIEESEVRKRLLGFLKGDLSLDDFEDWLVISSWDMHLDSEPGAQELVWAIELALSEHSSRHLSYDGLKQEFGDLVNHVVFSVEVRDETIVQRPVWWRSGAVATLLQPPEIHQLA